MPRFKEKPDIYSLELSHKRPPTPAFPGLPNELPPILSVTNGSTGAVHITG